MNAALAYSTLHGFVRPPADRTRTEPSNHVSARQGCGRVGLGAGDRDAAILSSATETGHWPSHYAALELARLTAYDVMTTSVRSSSASPELTVWGGQNAFTH